MRALVFLAAGLLGIAAWAGLRRSRASPSTSQRMPAGAADEVALVDQPLDPVRVETSNRAATERLWVLAFAAPSQSQASDVVNRRVRDNVVAMLQVDILDPKYFPRRPALMPQLIQAVNDPRAAAEKLSRIVSHDPVLTSDVLRLANSGLYRMSPAPIETIQRAIVVCGVDALRGMLAAAMLRPVFKATSKNFPRLPRMLWERTERAARAAELYAAAIDPADRFEAQLAVLLNALGPLVVYSAALDVYSRNPHFPPSADLCVELISEWAPRMSRHIARDWQTSPRLLAALEQSPAEPLYVAREVGELFGTLSLLESQTVIARDERLELLTEAGLPLDLSSNIWAGLTGSA